jgi:hypothetical protein
MQDAADFEANTRDDQYLWDATGPADPEVQRLEQALVKFRHANEVAAFLDAMPARDLAAQRLSWRTLWLPAFACATVIGLVLVGSQIVRRSAVVPAGFSAWDITAVEGAPRIGPGSISANTNHAKLAVGETLVTDGRSRASLSEKGLGEIKVDPNSRVRLIESDDHRKRIQLVVGSIQALIWAPPGEFSVDTPSATAVDLGCAYTLQVLPDGSGTIRTTLGWVGFHRNGRDSFIPAGAICNTRRDAGPGTPYFEDAPPALPEALLVLDYTATTPAERSVALHEVLGAARPRDALTLWHLLSRTSGSDREAVYDRLAALAPPPSGVTRDGVLALNATMLDAWWNSFGLGDISLWRYFEQNDGPRANGAKGAAGRPTFSDNVR